jgi:hypothetical protein
MNRTIYTLAAVAALIAAALALRGQYPSAPTQTSIWSGNPTIGSTCIAPYTPGVSIYLTPGGSLVTCPNSGGVWASWPFGQFQGTQSAVNMTGSDVPLFTFVLPPLGPGACYEWQYAIGPSTSAVVKVYVDSSVVSQPYTWPISSIIGYAVGPDQYCNNSSSQTSQVLVWLAPPFPDSDLSSYSDQWINYPPNIDWSKGHVLTITANQSSGSIIPEYARVWGGY